MSAFFGLDNALPFITIGLSWKAPGKDGMPIVFSQELNPATLEPSDFKIKTAKGNLLNVDPRDDANDFTSLEVVARW